MADAAAYLDQLQQLLPPGDAWSREPDAMFTGLLNGIATEFARADARALALVEEADPRTALELLPDWERVVGLPDACTPAIATTVPERRLAIHARLAAGGGQSIAYLTALAASLGYAVTIEEFGAHRCAARPGRLAGADWAFVFHVAVSANLADDRRARAGAVRAGDRIHWFGNTALECVIRRAKPAHTVALFTYA